MQRPGSYSATPALTKLIIINIAVFIVQNIALIWFHSPAFMKFFGLSGTSLQSGYLWTLVTYGFLHDSVMGSGLLHILFNMLVIFFMGRNLEPLLGTKKFLILYFSCILAGGAFWLLFHMGSPGFVVGASAAAVGLLICFCCMFPDQPMTFLLFFVLPVTLKPKWIAWAVTAIEVFGLLFTEIPGAGAIANSAHLGGIIAGYLFYFFVIKHQGLSQIRVTGGSFKTSLFKKNPLSPGKFKINISRDQNLKAQADEILDKINKEGFGSLTEKEKNILEQAKDQFRH